MPAGCRHSKTCHVHNKAADFTTMASEFKAVVDDDFEDEEEEDHSMAAAKKNEDQWWCEEVEECSEFTCDQELKKFKQHDERREQRQQEMEIQLCRVLFERFPETPKKSLYTLARYRVHALGCAAVLAVYYGDDNEKLYQNACKLYFSGVRALVNAKDHAASSHSHVSASKSKAFDHHVHAFLSEEADFFTKVATPILGKDEAFACKRRSCRFYGRKDQWLEKPNFQHGWLLRCPHCANKFKHWSPNTREEHNYADVVQVVNPCTGKTVICTATSSDSSNAFYSDPNVEKEMVVKSWMEVPVRAVADASQGHKMSAAELLLELDNMLAARFVPAQEEGFKWFRLKPETQRVLMEIPAFNGVHAHVWKGHADNGFYGNILPVEVADQQAWDEMPTFYDLLTQLLKASGEDAVKLKGEAWWRVLY
jgi:predicted RNA-binding protein with PUA-like domain